MAGTVTEVERMVARLIGDNSSYISMLKQSEAQAKSTASAIKGYGSQIESIGMSLNSLAMSTASVIGSITGSTQALSSFSRFDHAMTESTAIMQVTEEQVKRMKDAAINASAEWGRSAHIFAESFYFLASAGLDAESAISTMPAVARFAVAGNFDLAQATTLAADAQAALGLKSKDAAKNLENMVRVTDVLTKGNTLANATTRQLSTALTHTAGAALRAFSKDIEEGVAVLSAMADQGIKAEKAGNDLGRILRLLSSSAVEHAEGHRRLGFAVFDEAGNMKNLADVVENLEQVLGPLSDKNRTTALEILGFEARVQATIIPLIGTSKAIREYEKELRKAGGTTTEVAEKMKGSFSVQMSILANHVALLAIDIGTILAPALVYIGGLITSGFEAWRSLNDSLKQSIILTGLFAGALVGIGPAMLVLRPIGALLVQLITPLITLLPTAIMTLLNPLRLIVFWFNPMFILFRNIAGVAAAFIVAIQRVGGIQEAWYKVEEGFIAVYEWLVPIKDALYSLATSTIKAVIEAFVVMGEIVLGTFKWMAGFISVDWNTIRNVIVVGIKTIEMVIINAREIIGSVFQVLTKYALMFWDALTAGGEGAGDWVKPLVDSVLFVKDVIISFAIGVAAGMYGLYKAITSVGSTFDILYKIAAETLNGVTYLFRSVYSIIESVVNRIVGTVFGIFEALHSTIEKSAGVIYGVYDSLNTAFGKMFYVLTGGLIGISNEWGVATKEITYSAEQVDNTMQKWGNGVKIAVGVVGALIVVVYALSIAYRVLMVQQIIAAGMWLASAVVTGVILAYNALTVALAILAFTYNAVVVSITFLVSATAVLITWIELTAASFSIAAITEALYSAGLWLATAANIAFNTVLIVTNFLIANLGVTLLAVVVSIVLFKLAIIALTVYFNILAFLVMAPIGLAIYALGTAFAYIASPIIGAYYAIYALIDALGKMPTDIGPIAHIGGLFKEWASYIPLIVYAIQTDLPLAWQIVGSTVELAILQIKEAWPPLWEFIKVGFAAVARSTKAIIGEVFDYIQGRSTISANLWSMGISPEEAQKQVNQLGKIFDDRMKVIGSTLGRELGQATTNFKIPDTSPEIDKARKSIKELSDELDQIAFDKFMDELLREDEAVIKMSADTKKTADAYKKQQEQNINLTKNTKNEVQRLDAALTGSAEHMTRLQHYLDQFFGGDKKDAQYGVLDANKVLGKNSALGSFAVDESLSVAQDWYEYLEREAEIIKDTAEYLFDLISESSIAQAFTPKKTEIIFGDDVSEEDKASTRRNLKLLDARAAIERGGSEVLEVLKQILQQVTTTAEKDVEDLLSEADF